MLPGLVRRRASERLMFLNLPDADYDGKADLHKPAALSDAAGGRRAGRSVVYCRCNGYDILKPRQIHAGGALFSFPAPDGMPGAGHEG